MHILKPPIDTNTCCEILSLFPITSKVSVQESSLHHPSLLMRKVRLQFTLQRYLLQNFWIIVIEWIKFCEQAFLRDWITGLVPLSVKCETIIISLQIQLNFTFDFVRKKVKSLQNLWYLQLLWIVLMSKMKFWDFHFDILINQH